MLILGHSLKTNTVIGGRFVLPFLLLSPGVLELQTCVTVLGEGGSSAGYAATLQVKPHL